MLVRNYLRNNRKSVLVIVFYTMLSAIFISLIPISTKYVIDNYQELNLRSAIFYSLLYILAIIFFLFFEYKKKISVGKFGREYSVSVNGKVYESITKMSFKKIDQKSTGDVINAITNDTDTIYENYIYSYISLYISMISFFVYMAYMIYLNWILSIAIILSSALSFFIPKIVGKKMKDKRKDVSDKNAILVENLENLM